MDIDKTGLRKCEQAMGKNGTVGGEDGKVEFRVSSFKFRVYLFQFPVEFVIEFFRGEHGQVICLRQLFNGGGGGNFFTTNRTIRLGDNGGYGDFGIIY